ncbi:MAG: diacylglycerol kinase family protein [Burkholderiales bacterium]
MRGEILAIDCERPDVMHIVAIVNPLSGAGLDRHAARHRVDMIHDELRRRDLTATIHVTERSGHARELAEAAVDDRADLAIVWGGDGTVNEVGGALAGSPTALGLIPAGSGNGLAGGLGVPRDPHAALETALGERTIAVDVGMLDNRPFFNIAGIGFDAHIARLFNQRPRGRRGRLPYIVIGVREGCQYAGKDYSITLDGRQLHTRALLIAFANGQEYGMGMRIAPAARLDDGLLEACVVADRSVLTRFRDARHLALGSVHRAPGMIIQSIRSATLESEGDIEFHLDGEPGVVRDRLTVTIRPGALMVKV